MALKTVAIAIVFALLTAGAADVPPASLVQENVGKASVIVRGRINSWEAPKPGVTVAQFRVSHSYRGKLKSGDTIRFASFKEDDKYPDRLLHTDLVVFLRPRKARYSPPKWETATDLSEFVFVPELEGMLKLQLRRSQR